jgi:Yip1 domain
MATTPASTPMPTPEDVRPAKISPFGRVIGVLFSPKTTFEDIIRKPSWILPVILTTILSLAAVAVLNQRMNWREYMSEQIEKNPQAAQLSPEQKESRVDFGVKLTTYIVWLAGLIGPFVFVILVGGILMVAYNLLAGAGVRFSQAMAVVAHAGMTALISAPVFILVVFLKSPGTIDPNNPVATNLAAFLPEEAAKWLVTLCKSIDIFTIWSLILMAIGFAAINPRKLKGAKSFTIVFLVWGMYVVIRTLFAFVFS